MTRWERLEEWLFDHDVERFDVTAIANSMDVTTPEASAFIQSYLNAQRASKSRTLYVLKREGRTARAVWSVGQRTADARAISRQAFSDIERKVKRAFEPDLRRLAARNPRAARHVDTKIEQVIGGALRVLAGALMDDEHLNGDES